MIIKNGSQDHPVEDVTIGTKNLAKFEETMQSYLVQRNHLVWEEKNQLGV